MFKTQAFRVYGALLSSMLIWGFSFLAIKDVIGVVPIFSLLFVRFFLAAILLGIMVWSRKALRMPKRSLLIAAGLSLLSPVGYFLFETFGVAYTQPSHVAVIIATIPIAVYLIAFFRRQEKITRRKSVGVAVGYSGIILMVGLGQAEAGASLLGDALVLGAVLCAATRTSLIKDALTQMTPLQLTFYQFLFSLVIFTPLAATEGFAWVGNLTPLAILEILFLGVLCSAVAFLGMHYALAHLSATQVAVSANLVPVVTLMAEVTLLGSPLTLAKAGGTLLVILGVALTQLARKNATPRNLAISQRGG